MWALDLFQAVDGICSDRILRPSKKSVQVESLGFGFAKLVSSGFICMVLMFIPKLLEYMNSGALESLMQNGFQRPFNIETIRDYIKSLKHDQVRPFAEQLRGHIFKVTCAAGSTVVCPPGWISIEKTISTLINKQAYPPFLSHLSSQRCDLWNQSL